MTLAISSVTNSQLFLCLRCAAALTRKLMTYSAALALAACANNGYIEALTYKHYYFYEPRAVVAPGSAIHVTQGGQTIDLEFEKSENILSVATIASRGERGLILGSPGKAANFTGLWTFDAARTNGESIPMRLWVAASCRAEDWAMHPNKVRLVALTRDSLEVPLSAYLQPLPAALHPDPQVLSGHWQYAQLDSSREIHCKKGDTVAFTVGFDMTLALSHIKIVLADSLESDGKVVGIPDVELFLTDGKIFENTKRYSILETIFRVLGGLSR